MKFLRPIAACLPCPIVPGASRPARPRAATTMTTGVAIPGKALFPP
jgi:hypothetical protein